MVLYGASLRQVAQDPGMPHYVTLMAWQRRDPDFAKMLDWARSEGRSELGARKVERVDSLVAARSGKAVIPERRSLVRDL